MAAAKPLLLLLILSLSLSTLIHPATSAPTADSSAFIKSSCDVTRYPDLCRQCLSTYARSIPQNDHRRLALAALSVSLAKSKLAAAYVSQAKSSDPKVVRAAEDCTRSLGNGVSRLDQSVKELEALGGGGDRFEWHMSNVETWVSAALTDLNACVQGFSGRSVGGGPVRDKVRRRVVYVAMVTSNSLALVQRFARQHARAGRRRSP